MGNHIPWEQHKTASCHGDWHLLRDCAAKLLGPYRVTNGILEPNTQTPWLPGAVAPAGCQNHCSSQVVSPRVGWGGWLDQQLPHTPTPTVSALSLPWRPRIQLFSLWPRDGWVSTCTWSPPAALEQVVPAQLMLSNWILVVTSSLPRPGGSVPSGQCTWGINIGEVSLSAQKAEHMCIPLADEEGEASQSHQSQLPVGILSQPVWGTGPSCFSTLVLNPLSVPKCRPLCQEWHMPFRNGGHLLLLGLVYMTLCHPHLGTPQTERLGAFTQTFALLTDALVRQKRQPRVWGENIANLIYHKGLIHRIEKIS